MRLLLVGAFGFPHDQGSQVYFQEQALALRAAGAEVEVLSYGPGRSGAVTHPLSDLPFHSIPAWAAPTSRRSGPQAAKPFADLLLALALRRLVADRLDRIESADPSPGRSGDGSQAASSFASKDASSIRSEPASSASSQRPKRAETPIANGPCPAASRFDAILAHNAEAALLALHMLPAARRPPVVYCAHTLLAQELPQYFKSPRSKRFSTLLDPGAAVGKRVPRNADFPAPGAANPPAPALRRGGMTQSWIAHFGCVMDERIAARCDGWIALTQAAARVMADASDAPGRWIAPPVPGADDAEQRSSEGLAAPGRMEGTDRKGREAADRVRSLGLQPGGYFLYSGNLDPYQDLPLLEAVAERRRGAAASTGSGEPIHAADAGGLGDRSARSGASSAPLPIVVATHDERALPFAVRSGYAGGAGLVVWRVRSAAEAKALLVGARASLVPRRSLGGFPIKLANSLAAGIPVVALHGAEWGLAEGRDALIGDLSDPVGSLARALERLELDPALAARLGEGALATHRRQHDPARVAAETLALIAEVVKRRG